MHYTAAGLPDIAALFVGLAEDLEERAAHALQEHEREMLRARAGVWREAARVLATTFEAAPAARANAGSY